MPVRTTGIIEEHGLVEECVELYSRGHAYNAIAKHFSAKYGLSVSHGSVRRTVLKHYEPTPDGRRVGELARGQIPPELTARPNVAELKLCGPPKEPPKRPARDNVEFLPPPPAPIVPQATYTGAVEDDRDTLHAIMSRFRAIILAGRERTTIPLWAARMLSDKRREGGYTGVLTKHFGCGAITDPAVLDCESMDPSSEVEVLLYVHQKERAALAARVMDALKFKYGQRLILDGKQGDDDSDDGDSDGDGTERKGCAADPRGSDTKILPDAALIHILAGQLPPDGVGQSPSEARGAADEVRRVRGELPAARAERKDRARASFRGADGGVDGADADADDGVVDADVVEEG